MSEHRLLELLAEDAPVARPRLADGVIGRARHDRVRRWAVSGACAAVVVIAAIPLAVAVNRSPHSAHRTSPGGRVTNTETSSAHAPAPSSEALAYAAGVKYLTRELVPGRQWKVVYLLEHTCSDVISQSGSCDPRPIPAGLRHDLAIALRPYAPVRFVSDDAKIRDKQLQVINGGVAVTLGRIELNGETGRLPLAVQCGGLCGLGETLVLAKRAGVWTVTGSTGPSWIS
jgi:hypothetical protein